ncbi:UNVERIFIED_CONTAM: ABC transporter B family member 21 [Sesamum radiatum]|uniref:ABC transporter B family member 21 n=1 Tax=Sesamum radiatum TaxID=300843 RepID=A0AAW2W463_SESRA
MEVGWFDEPQNSSGVIGARLSADAATIRALVGDALAQLVQDLSARGGTGYSFYRMLAVGAYRPWHGTSDSIKWNCATQIHDRLQCRRKASQVANDAVGTIRTVASYCAEDKEHGLLRPENTFSDVFRVFFALTMAAVAISQSSTFAPDSSKAKSATASIFAILDRKSDIDPSDESGTTLENLRGEIELRHISFKYPTRPNVRIFRDLSLTIHSGKTVALVGESGSGKSTVVSLLQRFYDPDSGVITIDGIDIQKFQLKWLRQQMGLVGQEPILFNETIRDNIAYGKEGNATEAEIIAAAELANAHKFISGLQQGYDTMVGDEEFNYEATSALDAESERVVQDALDRVMVNRTTVVVAHRLSTIKGADLIAVVKNGVIVEKGKHDSLINIKDGFYASLVALHMAASS